MLSIRQTIDRLAGLLARNGPRVYTQYMYNYCISRRILFLQAERWTRRYSTRTRYQTVDVQGCGLVISAVLYVRVIFFSSICMLDLTRISGRHSNSFCDRIEKRTGGTHNLFQNRKSIMIELPMTCLLAYVASVLG